MSRIESVKPWKQHPVSSLQNMKLFGFYGVYMRRFRGFHSTVYMIIAVKDEKGLVGLCSVVKVSYLY